MSYKPESIEILGKCINNTLSDPAFNGRSVRFNITEIPQNVIDSACADLKLPCETHLNNQCEIIIDVQNGQGSLFFFFDEIDFCKRANIYLNNFEVSHFVILSNANRVLEKTSDEIFSSEKAIFFNFYFYHEILSFLEKQVHFMSFHSRADLRFVIFTSEIGPFDIKYNLIESRIKNLENLGSVYTSLCNDFEKVDFVQFFKAAVISTIHEYPIEDRFFYLVQSMRVILNVALRDHTIYIRNFDFDKIKSKFREERNKYFEAIEKNIDSIKGQVTSFPLTFAVSIFTGYQVKDKPAILILVFLAYSLYTFIAWRILSITLYNTASIKSDIGNEEDKIKKGYEVLYSEFESDFLKIKYKISKVENLVTILRTVLLGLLICFLIFGIYEIFFAVKNVTQPIDVHIVNG